MEYTDDLSDFMTFVGTISILVYSVHCPAGKTGYQGRVDRQGARQGSKGS